MGTPLKAAFWVVGILAGLVVIAGLALVLLVDANAYKGRAEEAASKALNVDVRVQGPMNLGFWPGLHVGLADVSVGDGEKKVGTAKTVRLELSYLPLLAGEIRIEEIKLHGASVRIERDAQGRFNIRLPEERNGAGKLRLEQISLRDSVVRWVDRKAGYRVEGTGCRLEISELRTVSDSPTGGLRRMAFSGEGSCAKARTTNVTVSGLQFSVNGERGRLTFDPIRAGMFSGEGEGQLIVDLTGKVPHVRLHYQLQQMRTQELIALWSEKNLLEGNLVVSADLETRGDDAKELKRNATGDILLRGEDLILHGRDLDEALSEYKSIQNFSIVDVGAFFLAGPVGVVVTKGYDYAKVFEGSGGSTSIRRVVSKWKVRDGVAHAQDVAMSTDENRIALAGSIDFVEERFEDVTVAVLDQKGCAKIKQSIRGPLSNPDVEKPSVLASLVGPARELVEKAKDVLTQEDCEVFYSGDVAPPAPQKD